jgi:cell division protein FtsZ
MREGPLAALFRKTSEDLPELEEKPSKPRRAASGERKTAARARSEPAGEREPAAQVPTPQERLRHAFAADIPQNLLDNSRALPEEEDVFARPQRATSAYATPGLASERFAGKPVIRVVGVGGAGVNAINRMVEAEIEGVEFLAINTDLQSLQTSAAPGLIQSWAGWRRARSTTASRRFCAART